MLHDARQDLGCICNWCLAFSISNGLVTLEKDLQHRVSEFAAHLVELDCFGLLIGYGGPVVNAVHLTQVPVGDFCWRPTSSTPLASGTHLI